MRTDLLKEYIKEDPDDPFLQYALGLEYRKTGLNEEAREQFRHVGAKFREYLPNYYQLGQLLLELGMPGEGTDVLREGIELALSRNEAHTAAELRTLLEEYLPDH